MKRPSLIQVIAIVNSILVLYMLYTVYELKQPRSTPKALPSLVSPAQTEAAGPDALLASLEAKGPVSDKLQSLRKLPPLPESDAKRLHRWLHEQLLPEPSLDRLERLDAIDAAYRALIRSESDAEALAREVEGRVRDNSLWLPERNQALILLFLLYADKSPEAETGEAASHASGQPEAVAGLAQALRSAIQSAANRGDTTLAATCLEGSLYLLKRELSNPAQSSVESLAETVLSEPYQPETQLKAIQYAQTSEQDIVVQAATLLKSSSNVTVAIAAKKYLMAEAERAAAPPAAEGLTEQEQRTVERQSSKPPSPHDNP